MGTIIIKFPYAGICNFETNDVWELSIHTFDVHGQKKAPNMPANL